MVLILGKLNILYLITNESKKLEFVLYLLQVIVMVSQVVCYVQKKIISLSLFNMNCLMVILMTEISLKFLLVTMQSWCLATSETISVCFHAKKHFVKHIKHIFLFIIIVVNNELANSFQDCK